MRNAVLILLLYWALPTVASDQPTLRIAIASSVDNTELATILINKYKETCSCDVSYVVAGSSRALFIADNNADVAITHAPILEDKFIAKQAGRSKYNFMKNEFIIIGPKDDPAQIKGMDLIEALKQIEDKKALFITRADGSGTNLAELALWQQAIGSTPDDSWYVDAGVQMANALLIASQKNAYTLSDSATFDFLKAKNIIKSISMAKATPAFENIYSVVIANPENNLASDFASWLQSEAVKTLIASHSINGKALFIPIT